MKELKTGDTILVTTDNGNTYTVKLGNIIEAQRGVNISSDIVSKRVAGLVEPVGVEQ